MQRTDSPKRVGRDREAREQELSVMPIYLNSCEQFFLHLFKIVAFHTDIYRYSDDHDEAQFEYLIPNNCKI